MSSSLKVRSVCTYSCGCSAYQQSASPTCPIHNKPQVMLGPQLKPLRLRKFSNNHVVYASPLNYFIDKVSIDWSKVIIQNPTSKQIKSLRLIAKELTIIDNSCSKEQIDFALSSDYTVFLNCSIGLAYKNLRKNIHTPFQSVYRFLTRPDYRETVTGIKHVPGKLF